MTDLIQKKCVPCEGGGAPLTMSEVHRLTAQVVGWEVLDTYITKTYRFKDFADALAFVNRIGAIAEREGHHPDLTLTYNVVRVVLTTHALGGLSENDFIMAAKIDAGER